MAVDSTLIVLGGQQPYKLIVEPWADEHVIRPADRCSVVAIHPSEAASLDVEWQDSALIVWVNINNAPYQFWRNGALEHNMSIPIPGPPNFD
jgi:hypothetical protein